MFIAEDKSPNFTQYKTAGKIIIVFISSLGYLPTLREGIITELHSLNLIFS